MPGQSSSVGVPQNWKILNIWSISESPTNSGHFSYSSYKIHPIAQVSTPREYCLYPRRISGALYHRVSISWVRVLIGIENALAKPKSAIFKVPVKESINKFWGFKSQWIIHLLWQCIIPSNNCFMKYFICSWVKGCCKFFINFFISNSRYSKTRSSLFY